MEQVKNESEQEKKLYEMTQEEKSKLTPEQLVEKSGYYENSGCAGRTFFMAGAIGIGVQIFTWLISGARGAFSWPVLIAGLILIVIGMLKSEKDGSMSNKRKKEKETDARSEASKDESQSEKQALNGECQTPSLISKAAQNSTESTSTSPDIAEASKTKPKQKLEKRERYKKFKAWVDESFVNKTIFVGAIIVVFVIVAVLIPKGVKLIDKVNRINSGTVYFTRDGTRYHLYDDCSNMGDPRETYEWKAKEYGLERCSKCYSGVMNYTAHSSWDLDAWTFFLLGFAFVLILIFAILLKKSKWLQEKTAMINKEFNLFITSVVLLILVAMVAFALALGWGYI